MNKTSKLIQNIPKDISHLDSLGHKLISLDLNIKNPEYTDKIYRNRKLMIGELSKVHRMGQPIKEVVYTDIEHGTWRTVLGRLKLHQKNVMCSAYLQQMNVLN
jgi:phenylalanine-4-hydroxylase